MFSVILTAMLSKVTYNTQIHAMRITFLYALREYDVIGNFADTHNADNIFDK